jgi:hypothetical protein
MQLNKSFILAAVKLIHRMLNELMKKLYRYSVNVQDNSKLILPGSY